MTRVTVLRGVGLTPTETNWPETLAVLNGAWMPSIADELATELNTPRSRVARSRRYGLVWESLVELMKTSIAADIGQMPKGQRGT